MSSVPSVTSLANMIREHSASRIVLALSGGMDSMVLLELLHQARKLVSFELLPVYIHHGLSSNAGEWGKFCQQQAELRQLHCQIIPITLLTHTDLEQQARNARYQALADFITAPNHLLMTAHHADDQIETLLLALKRGAGLSGLGGMQKIRPFAAGFLVRPLLDFSRQQIVAYAAEHNLQWIEDESNNNQQFDRNFIRQQIMPLLSERWPAFVRTTSRSMLHLQTANHLLNDVIDNAVAQCCSETHLDLAKLRFFHPEQQEHILRGWLAKSGLNPSSQWLQTLQQQVIAARHDAEPLLLLGDYQIRRFADGLYLLKPLSTIPDDINILWQGEQTVMLPADLGNVYFSTNQRADMLPLTLETTELNIRFGLLNASFKPDGKLHKPLKQWFKLWKIPPWQRGRIPLLFQQQQLVAVAGCASCSNEIAANYWFNWSE